MEDFKRLLIKANSIMVKPKRGKNYFEVAGYPHYENVASSILAFYFDTNEEHGLNDLWLRSLIECYQNSNNEMADVFDGINAFDTAENGVIREELTSSNKRIDILIQTNNNFVVAIENKIYADIYNPFAEYSEWINESYSQYANKIEIVLSLYPVIDRRTLSGRDAKGNSYHFVNILYSELIHSVQRNIGPYLNNANEKWLIYMNEFIKNIDSLKEEKMDINKELQVFLDDNTELIRDFNSKIQDDQKAKIEFINELAKSLQERFVDASLDVPTKVYNYGTQSFASYLSLVIDITKGNTIIAIEPKFCKAGHKTDDGCHQGVFYVSIWIRQKEKRSEELLWVQSKLSDGNIQSDWRKSRGWGDYLGLNEFDFKKDISTQEVEDYLYNIWNTIVKSIITTE